MSLQSKFTTSFKNKKGDRNKTATPQATHKEISSQEKPVVSKREQNKKGHVPTNHATTGIGSLDAKE